MFSRNKKQFGNLLCASLWGACLGGEDIAWSCHNDSIDSGTDSGRPCSVRTLCNTMALDFRNGGSYVAMTIFMIGVLRRRSHQNITQIDNL